MTHINANTQDIKDVIKAMRFCYQTQNIDMLQHGIRVHRKYHDIKKYLIEQKPIPESWRLSDWIYNPILLEKQMETSIISPYMIFHDCGKPFVKTIDDMGRNHYPDHANKSAEIWLACHPETIENKEIAQLMRMDMDIHLLKADDIQNFSLQKQALTLLLVGIAEVLANAPMFGGFESTSFKIKMKHLNKRGKQIIQHIKGTNK